IRGARRDTSPVTPEAFVAAADSFVQASLRGNDPTGGMMALNGAAYHVVAIPAQPPEGLAGVLLFGIRITDSTLQTLRPPSSEILLTAGEQVLASTLKDSAQNTAVFHQLAS